MSPVSSTIWEASDGQFSDVNRVRLGNWRMETWEDLIIHRRFEGQRFQRRRQRGR